MTKNNSSTRSFTLLEMLIVLTLVSILIPAVFSMVFIIMRQQVRIYRVVETRQQGDFILSFMKEKLARTQEITDRNKSARCTSSSSESPAVRNGLRFIDNDGQYYAFYYHNNSIIYELYNSSNLNRANRIAQTSLNNSKVEVSNYAIGCVKKSEYSSPLIQISYTVTFKDNTPTVEEGTISLDYQTKMRLRSN